MSQNPINALLVGTKAIPVLSFESVEEAVQISSLLVAEGFSVLELTLRHPCALDALKALKGEFGADLAVGMGTIMNIDQLEKSIDAGADFGVSPGLTASLAEGIRLSGLPFLPGVATVSEAMTAQEYGFQTLKFFPAEQSGGAAFLKSISAVLPDVRFCPTGGVTANNAADYLALKSVVCFGTTAFTKRNAAGEIDPQALTEAVKTFRSNGLL